MQKISYRGVEYVPVAVIAKRFRYTKDYVGQLCRTGKVQARRVGRGWYVNPESVTAYRKTKHATQKTTATTTPAPATAASTVAINRKTKPVAVAPVTRAKTLRITQDTLAQQGHRRPAASATYTADTTPADVVALQARVDAAAPATVHVAAPAATTVPVQSTAAKQAQFTSEKLPEITLSGKLSVTQAAEENAATAPTITPDVADEQAAPADAVLPDAAPAAPKPPPAVSAGTDTATSRRPVATTRTGTADAAPVAARVAPAYQGWLSVGLLVAGVLVAAWLLSAETVVLVLDEHSTVGHSVSPGRLLQGWY